MAGTPGLRRGALPGLVPGAVAAVFLLLVWAASSGPVSVLSPSGRRHTPAPAATPNAQVSSSPSSPTLAETTRDVEQTLDLSWLGDLIAWAMLLGLLGGAALILRWAWRHRPRRPPAPTRVEFEVLPEQRVAEAIADDAAAQLTAIASGDPRNGVVRCWLMLQEAVAGAGLPPRPSETSAEFTVRVLHALDLDPRAIERLAGLYREARFSEHPLGEDARDRARGALEALHADLRSAHRAPGRAP